MVFIITSFSMHPMKMEESEGKTSLPLCLFAMLPDLTTSIINSFNSPSLPNFQFGVFCPIAHLPLSSSQIKDSAFLKLRCHRKDTSDRQS